MKVCNSCNQEKTDNSFYKRAGTNSLLSECKDCMLERSKTQKRVSKDMSAIESENRAIKYLRSHGIPTTTGKGSRFSGKVDLVSWGCVRIEVKYAELKEKDNNLRYTLSITPNQQKHGFNADVVCVIFSDNEGETYHFLPSNHPVFYHPDGKMKTAVTYTPTTNKYDSEIVSFDLELFTESRDNIEIINTYREAYVASLLSGDIE